MYSLFIGVLVGLGYDVFSLIVVLDGLGYDVFSLYSGVGWVGI